MRFVSKNSNLLIVLSPGLPAQPLTGTPAKSGVYIKFKDGIVDIKDDDLIAKMKGHPGYNGDFISVEENEIDPYASFREETEPVHHVADIKYGHVEKKLSSSRKVKIPPEIQKLIEDMAKEQAKAMLPGLMKEFLKEAAKINKEEQETRKDKTDESKK